MKSFFKAVVIKKFLWTLFFLFIYVLGTKLTLPFIDMSKAAAMDGTSTTLNYATALMGGIYAVCPSFLSAYLLGCPPC